MSNIATRNERIELRANIKVKATLEKAALLKHKTLSAYLLESALQKAESDLKESEIISLNQRDQDKFFTALITPPVPNKALKNLLKDDF
ncbi:MAG: DUF1778 domain-containing protein [Tannerellaceae bacterium]|nr:DUF1778 domain-containing protein [Tannerellaceae bacterium]